MSIRAVVHGMGMSVPKKIVTNDDLSKIVDTNDEWITQRTGIKQRHVCEEEETCVGLSLAAAREALAAAQLDPADLELVILATVTNDYIFPAGACFVQDALGAKNAGAFDLGAACAGFIYATATAAGMIESGAVENALVIGCDTLTKYLDWTDRSTCILFGDGAAAMVLQGEHGADRGLVKTVLLSDGAGANHIRIDGGGSKYPSCNPKFKDVNNTLFMAGPEVYRFAVTAMGDACMKLLDEVGMDPSEIDLFVPHQANLRIIESAKTRLKLSDDKVFVNVDRYGNTSAASVPIALYEAEKSGRLKKGDLVMTVGFGAGLVWGANLIRW